MSADKGKPIARIDQEKFEAARRDPRKRAFSEAAKRYWARARPKGRG